MVACRSGRTPSHPTSGHAFRCSPDTLSTAPAPVALPGNCVGRSITCTAPQAPCGRNYNASRPFPAPSRKDTDTPAESPGTSFKGPCGAAFKIAMLLPGHRVPHLLEKPPVHSLVQSSAHTQRTRHFRWLSVPTDLWSGLPHLPTAPPPLAPQVCSAPLCVRSHRHAPVIPCPSLNAGHEGAAPTRSSSSLPPA